MRRTVTEMPATEQAVKALTRRMARSMNFSGDQERRAEIGRVLEQQCANDAHAEIVAESMIRQLTAFPTVAEAWGFIESIDPPVTIGAANPACQRCNGGQLDWVYEHRPDGMSGVRRCPCRGGSGA